jgi:hypothetical protein
MTRMDPDITAVRNLPPGLPEPTEESLARTWHAIARRQSAREAPRRRRPLLVPVIAAATVLALTVGGVALRHLIAPSTPIPPASPPSFEEIMNDLIHKAGNLPAATPGSGDLVYVSTTGTSTANGVVTTHRWERWAAPRQMLPLRATLDGTDVDPTPDELEVDHRNIVGTDGGNWFFPTVQWLAAAPADGEALRRYVGFTDQHAVAHLSTIFSKVEPLVTAPLRVSLYQILATAPDMTAVRLTLDGRTVWALTQGQAHTYGHALFVDAETGRTVGTRSAWIGSPPPNRPELQKRKLRDDYAVQWTWRHAIVPSVNDRP